MDLNTKRGYPQGFSQDKGNGLNGVEIPLVNPMEIEFKLVEKMKEYGVQVD